ncbi:unnamed protein product [Laminaria digitata]
MTLGAEETSRLAAEGVEPTDDGSKFAWTSVGGKVMAMFDGDALSTSPSESGGTVTGSINDQGEAPTVGVILDVTSFYAEAGGQAADCGTISVVSSLQDAGDGGDDVKGVIEVADVRMFGGFALHVGRLVSGR